MPAIDQFARTRAPVVIVDNRAETLPHDGTRLVIGAIQREPGAKTEFHS